MGKVLFIEDELTANIPSVRKYFEPLLAGRNLLGQLDRLAGQSPVRNSDVVNVCNKASELDVVYKFPVALTKIVHRFRDYDLIIIDRDLSAYDYSAEAEKVKADLEAAGLSDPGQKTAEYRGREGDLLLLILLRLDPSYKDKIFLLAVRAAGIVQASPELETIIDLTHFSAGRILEKGADAEQAISAVIADLPAFTLQNVYREQCDILRSRFSDDEESVNQFIEVMALARDIDLKIDFLQKIRPLAEKLLVSLAQRIGDTRAPYWYRFHGKLSLQYKDFINSLDRIDKRYALSYNKNIRQCLFSLWQIPSDFATHTSGDRDAITIYTVNALANQLCDVILWFDQAMRNLENRQANK